MTNSFATMSKLNKHGFGKVTNRCLTAKQSIQTAVTCRHVHSSLLDNKWWKATENLYYLSVLCTALLLITNEVGHDVKLNCLFWPIKGFKRQCSPGAFRGRLLSLPPGTTLSTLHSNLFTFTQVFFLQATFTLKNCCDEKSVICLYMIKWAWYLSDQSFGSDFFYFLVWKLVPSVPEVVE